MTDSARRRRALAVTLIAGLPFAVLLVWPQLLGAQRAPLVAQVISFRAALAIGFGALAVVALIVVLATGRRSGRRRMLRAIASGFALLFALTSLGNTAVVLARGVQGTTPDGDVVVVAWNTQGGAATPESIVRLVVETRADVVSLPETDATAAAAVVRMLADEGIPMAADTVGTSIPTSVLIAEGLGEYRHDADAGSTPRLPSGVWRPVDGPGPVIVAAHPIPPLPDAMAQWWTGLGWATDLCADPDVIVAGDFNATADHLSGLLGDCRDAATEAGASAGGTWPTTVPSWMATPIDHVLAGSSWTVSGARVLTAFDDAGSDHRPIVAVLERS